MTKIAITGVAVVTIGLFWLLYFVNYHYMIRAGVDTLPKKTFQIVTWGCTIIFSVISIIAIMLN